MTIFCLKNVDPDPQKNADPAQKRSIFSENGPFLSRIRIRKINTDMDPKPRIRKKNALQPCLKPNYYILFFIVIILMVT